MLRKQTPEVLDLILNGLLGRIQSPIGKFVLGHLRGPLRVLALFAVSDLVVGLRTRTQRNVNRKERKGLAKGRKGLKQENASY